MMLAAEAAGRGTKRDQARARVRARTHAHRAGQGGGQEEGLGEGEGRGGVLRGRGGPFCALFIVPLLGGGVWARIGGLLMLLQDLETRTKGARRGQCGRSAEGGGGGGGGGGGHASKASKCFLKTWKSEPRAPRWGQWQRSEGGESGSGVVRAYRGGSVGEALRAAGVVGAEGFGHALEASRAGEGEGRKAVSEALIRCGQAQGGLDNGDCRRRGWGGV